MLRLPEAIEFARAVPGAAQPRRSTTALYSEAGLGIVDGHMNAFLPKEGLKYFRLSDGHDL